MGSFLDRQRKLGPVGEVAVRFEILLLSLMLYSGLTFANTNGYAIGYGVYCYAILVLGFVGAVKLSSGMVLAFDILMGLQVVGGIAMSVLVAFVIWHKHESTTHNILFLVYYAVGVFVRFMSVVWGVRLRGLIQEYHKGNHHHHEHPNYHTSA